MTTSTDSPLATSLAADPFTSLAVHYGMLLGVPDFQAIAANPRGKLRLHQAWQHGAGVVWGYDLSVPADSSELQVGAGLAVDGVGREIALGTPYCVDVAQWLADKIEAEEVEPDEVVTQDGKTQTFGAQLVLRFRACLTRPVPAMSTACDGAGNDIAYSRIVETGELELRPYSKVAVGDPVAPPDLRSDEYAALRALVRDGVLPTGTEPSPEGWLDAFRTVAADEVAALAPAGLSGGSPTSTKLFPVDEPAEIVLADLPDLQLVTTASGSTLVAPTIDLGIRRTHVPTWLITELLAEVLAGQAGGGPVPDAAGPRVRAVTVAADETSVTIELSGDIAEATLDGAFDLRSFDSSAATPSWSSAIAVTPVVTPSDPTTDPATPATIAFSLPAAPDADVTYRLVLSGTGPTPLVGIVDGRPIPLAGRAGGPAGSTADGHDVIEIFEGAQP